VGEKDKKSLKPQGAKKHVYFVHFVDFVCFVREDGLSGLAAKRQWKKWLVVCG
jgi:hypothetical protein